MRKRYCLDCGRKVEVMEETIEGDDYISCCDCGAVIAKLNFNWELPIDSRCRHKV